LRVLVDIQFSDLVSTLRLGSKLIHHRRDHSAWTTPRRPSIDKHRTSSLLHHVAIERLIGNVLRLRINSRRSMNTRSQLFSTPAAPRFARRQLSFVDTVLCATLPTLNDLHKEALFQSFFRI